MQPLTAQELHNLAMNIVGRQLEEAGFEFMGVNSKPKRNPQFVCLKEKQLHFYRSQECGLSGRPPRL